LASPLWFARKFDEKVDRRVLELLAQRIGADLPPHVARPCHRAMDAAGVRADRPGVTGTDPPALAGIAVAAR
jgi:hypothetical protein